MMDRFSRTLLAAAAESGLATITLSRHVPNLRRNIRPNDEVVMLTHALRPDGPLGGDHLLLLTRRRLVVTKQSRVLGRIRLDLDTPVSDLAGVRWSADPVRPGLELVFTEGEDQHRFWIDVQHCKQVWKLDALLAKMFRRPGVSAASATAAMASAASS